MLVARTTEIAAVVAFVVARAQRDHANATRADKHVDAAAAAAVAVVVVVVRCCDADAFDIACIARLGANNANNAADRNDLVVVVSVVVVVVVVVAVNRAVSSSRRAVGESRRTIRERMCDFARRALRRSVFQRIAQQLAVVVRVSRRQVCVVCC